MRNPSTVFGLAISLFMLGCGGAYAQDPNQGEADDIQIDKITCREMLKMDGDERKFTLIFLHGFISGKNSDLVFDGSALADATDVILDNCIDNPDESLLAVFEKTRS